MTLDDSEHAREAGQSWQMYSSLRTPASFERTHVAILVVVSVGLALYTALASTVYTRWRQQSRQDASARSKSRRLVLGILVNALSNLAQMIFHAWLLSASAGVNASRCHAGHKASTALYVFTSVSLYWFLAVRAEATLDRRNALHMAVYRVCKVGLVFGSPVMMLMCALLFDGRVFFGWACMQELKVELAVLFLVLDSGISLLLLLLFYLPVRKHVADLQNEGVAALNGEAQRVHRSALRTLRLSLVQVLSTFCAQLVGVATQLAFDDAADPGLAFWRNVRSMLYAADLFINTACMLVMTDAWVPAGWPRLQAWMASLRDAQSTAAAASQQASRASRASRELRPSRVSPASVASASSKGANLP